MNAKILLRTRPNLKCHSIAIARYGSPINRWQYVLNPI